jgi:excinuclease UvrABC nuclease subunit
VSDTEVKRVTLAERGLRIVGDRIIPLAPKPAPRPCVLYRHFDADGTLLYVGISVSVLRRLAQHVRGSHWTDKIASITIERFASEREAAKAEEAAIRSEKPLHNVRMSETPRTWPEFTEEESAREMAKLEDYLRRSAP